MRTQLVLLSTLLLLGGPAAAEGEREPTPQPPPRPAPPGLSPHEELLLRESAPPAGPSIAQRAFGLTAEPDGRLLGGGPDYRVSFEARGPVVTTALGAEAPRSLPLSFELESASLGAVPLAAGGAAVPARAGANEVVYLRGGGVEERYELRREGVEQSFVFHALPDGGGSGGDLLVRGRVSTELAAPVATPEGGLLFRAPGGGGVRVGAVLGIDADGRTSPGEVRWQAPWLELSLPEEFVAGAALPLVLDPLIGSMTVVNGDLDEIDPDVAYDATFDTYLVTWERRWSSTDFDVRAQRVASDGSLLGSVLTLEGAVNPVAQNPSVAGVAVSSRFLVAWQEAPGVAGPWDVRGRAIDAGTGALSATVTISADPASELDPDVGGDAGTGDDEALVVWTDAAQGIRLAQVTLASSGAAPFVFGDVAVSSMPGDRRPAIAKSGGTAGVHLVTWQRFFSTPAPGDHDLLVRLFTKDTASLTGEVGLPSTVGPDEEDPDADGDGAQWLLAYEKEAAGGSGDNDVVARRLTWSGTALSVGSELVVEGEAADDEHDPAVGWTGESWIVAYVDATPFGDDDLLARVVTQEPAVCGDEVGFALTGADEEEPQVATRRSGSPTDTSREALLAWQAVSSTTPFTGGVRGIRFRADVGAATDLGGGCVGGGTARAACGVVGNDAFAHRIEGALPFSVVYLLLGFSKLDYTCGICRLVPNPYESLVFSATTDASGNASISMPIPDDPALAGATFLEQWVVPGGVTCPALGSALSNALQVVIQ